MENVKTITGKTLIDWGFAPGPWFQKAIGEANALLNAGSNEEAIKQSVAAAMPVVPVYVPRQAAGAVPIHYNITATNDFERDNLDKVREHVNEISTVPTVRAIGVMPDACPAGKELGTIPVGGVVVAENAIHPGMHSADVCCSVAISVFPDDTNPTDLLDAGMKLSHFGAGGRPYSHDLNVPQDLLDSIGQNFFLRGTETVAQKFLGTQGDGNHFFYVGRLQSTGQIALVTHHGSRKIGALLYKKGLEVAKTHTDKICPDVSRQNVWIPYDTEDGQAYWEALQLVRRWTKHNHFGIHDMVAKNLGLKVKDRYWNEHNFVFKRDNFFYHAKGSTPNYQGFAPDSFGKTLIPLSMSEPILVCQVDEDRGAVMDDTTLGFCPHGAGRLFSRTQFEKNLAAQGIKPADLIADLLKQYDIRAYSGKYDISEWPTSYKPAQSIIDGIDQFGLTTVVDKVMPIGSIMAGHSGYVRRHNVKPKAE